MDAFFASVEQRDNPSLKGKPVIVGGSPDSRGVVCAASYEARKFGVHSAMASSRAYRLCPQGIFIRPHFEAYEEVSNQIREIFIDYTDLVEPLSLDEAYLDVTENKKGMRSATMIAQEIRKRIADQTHLTASAGVSFNKFLAKVASDYHKPNGITVITPDQADAFIEALPIGKFFGIGKVTEKKMLDMGIKTGRDLKQLTREHLLELFGRFGVFYYDIVRGVDDRSVCPYRVRKSYGRETTLSEDITDIDMMLSILDGIALEVSESLINSEVKGRTITLKIKYFNFTSVTRSVTIDHYTDDSSIIMENVRNLIRATEAGKIKVRLLGISISNLDIEEDASEVDGDCQLCFPF